VWKHGCFGWEYKSRGRDLRAAYAQLQRYAPALENPPLLIVCDLARFEIRELRSRSRQLSITVGGGALCVGARSKCHPSAS